MRRTWTRPLDSLSRRWERVGVRVDEQLIACLRNYRPSATHSGGLAMLDSLPLLSPHPHLASPFTEGEEISHEAYMDASAQLPLPPLGEGWGEGR